MCSGVVPQQPPTMFSQPLSANSPSMPAIVGRAEIVLAHLVGQAGVRIATDRTSRRLADSSSMCGRIMFGPERAVHADREQREVRDRSSRTLRRSGRRRTSRRRRSNVPETITGRRWPLVFEILLDGEQARLEIERVDHRFGQQDIDARLRPAPRPARSTTRPSGRTSRRASRGLRRVVEIAICLVVGPIEPATNRGLSGVRSLNSSHAAAGTAHRGRVDLADQLPRQLRTPPCRRSWRRTCWSRRCRPPPPGTGGGSP